jgi:putative glutamine amidotransferase
MLTSVPEDPMPRPQIVITVALATASSNPVVAARKNALYAEAVARHGGRPILLDAAASADERADAFAAMDGLLLSGGADIAPARYGRAAAGSDHVEPRRDALEAAAWTAAVDRSVPVLGVCRGLQAINVFSGGTLLQDIDGHAGAPFGQGPPATHPLRIVPGTALDGLVSGDGPLVVNSYHHQAIGAADLAPGLIASAWADSAAGPLVEGLEAADGRFVLGVQCHPERTESTAAPFERLFAAFIAAARH